MQNGLLYRNNGNARLLTLLPHPPGTILDCGCGAGDNAKLLSAQGWKVTGVTISPEEARVASEFCDDVYLLNLESGLPDEVVGNFDVILMSHVLEHLADPTMLLVTAREHLTRNGLVAVALPNVLHYRQRFDFLRGKFAYSDTGPLDRTHLRFYTYRTARELIESVGLQVLREAPDGWFPLGRLRHSISTRQGQVIDRWACRYLPNLFAYQSLFIAYRAEEPNERLPLLP